MTRTTVICHLNSLSWQYKSEWVVGNPLFIEPASTFLSFRRLLGPGGNELGRLEVPNPKFSAFALSFGATASKAVKTGKFQRNLKLQKRLR
jgi:hypothetical protein